MNRLQSRLARMERLTHATERQPPNVHFFTIETDEDPDARIAAMVAQGEAGPDDLFIFRRIGDPVRSRAA